LIVDFIRDLDRCDNVGDQGRYPTAKDGSPALAKVCCADPTLLREHVDRLHSYVQSRLQTSSTVPGDSVTDPTEDQ
jgi:hypothetical protein